MVNPEKQQSAKDRQQEDGDRVDQNFSDEDMIEESSTGAETNANPSIARRLTQIFVEDGDGDLLLQRGNGEGGLLQWLLALDLQVMGACRADERLKPFLKLNISTGMAEDGLLAHLSQHFEPSEVGILARCLCIPLVSVRVGKIKKKGSILSPTSSRGNLCLTLLPTSDLRISFAGDDGSTERLATLSTVTQCDGIEIEAISADTSGRSFLIKISGTIVYYFWCSEKSKLLGDELLKNMKDLLIRKPSLAELTGISESRLNCFASNLRAYLAGSMVANTLGSDVLKVTTSPDNLADLEPQSSFSCQKISRFRHSGNQGSKANLIYQGSLSPKSNPFKEVLPKILCFPRTGAREKLKRRMENPASCFDGLDVASSTKFEQSSSTFSAKHKVSEPNGSQPLASLGLLDALGKHPFIGSEILDPSASSLHPSPHYCWCPPVASALQYTIGNPSIPISSTESLSLPPLSSILSATAQSRLLTSKQSLNTSELPPFDFPTFLSEPVVRLPTPQQIPTFTPLICDPIVHIPVIDICSSGQGYLVSAGPAIMSTTIPPLNPNLVDPLPHTESVLEKSARETLCMLINSSNQPSPQLMDVFPSMLGSGDDKKNLLASAGSRGLFSGTVDVNVLTHSLTTMGLALLSEKPVGSSLGKRCASKDDLVIDQKEKPSSSGPSSYDEGID